LREPKVKAISANETMSIWR